MAQCTDTNNCIEVNDLKMHFMLKSGLFSKPKVLKAVDGVTFSIEKGRTMGLVGESGCGKTTVGRTILKLYQATAGRILYQGTDITGLSDSQMVPYRKKMQMIFQDPYTSLDPRKNIGDIIAEPIWAMKLHTGKDKNDRVRELIEMVGLKPDHINRYPHEFSGGQRQRIGIARALAAEPEFIVCDEPISALDVSIQAQVINILEELQDKFHFTYLFISHDLSVVEMISDRIGVMYLGTIVETAPKKELYANPRHPYTRALLSAVPIPDPEVKKERITLKGDLPSPSNPPSGCLFHTRCPHCTGKCKTQVPTPVEIAPGHIVKCHYPELTE